MVFNTVSIFMLSLWMLAFYDQSSASTEQIIAKAGENITLPCPGLSDPSYVTNLEWRCRGCILKDGEISEHYNKILRHEAEVTTYYIDNERLSLEPNTFGVAFHPVRASDLGDYSCIINDHLYKEHRIHLTVQDVPDSPGRPFIVSFTSRAMNLSWSPSFNDHNSPIQHYIIQTRVGEDAEWDNDSIILTPDNSTVYQVTQLLPFSVYSFRIFAENSIGRSQPSKASYYTVTLPEAPDSRPTIISARNLSAASIKLEWEPPPKHTINGELLGFKITYRPRSAHANMVKEITLARPDLRVHTIQDLNVFTQYVISLQVYNAEGFGPSTSIAVSTDEGIPSRPENLTASQVTDTTFYLHWEPPSHPNSQILGYNIYFMQKNFTDVKSVKNFTHFDYYLSDLTFTWKNEGEASDPLVLSTDVSAPTAPVVYNLSCHSPGVIFFGWRRPRLFYHTLDYYYVLFRREDMFDFEEIIVHSQAEKLDHTMLLPNLTTDHMYEVKVQAGTKSILRDFIYRGAFSESRKVLLHPDCQHTTQSNNFHSHLDMPEMNAGIVAGMIFIAFALLLSCVALVLWRKYLQIPYSCLEDPAPLDEKVIITWDQEDEPGIHPILVNQFPSHVSQLHADGDIGFSKEYEALQIACDQSALSADLSQHPDNKPKNRYMNIVAYDHSCVRLRPMPGCHKTSEYLNANYIDGYKKSRAYIATQGPLPATFDEFWRMIWEQRVYVIVMITNLVERGRVKCKKGRQIEHLVYQYHYTSWPDHGTPDHPLPILRFVRKSAAMNPPNGGPIVVHCSAGVGRTGTYIALDALLRQARATGQLSVFAYLRHIRQQRNFLVQTEEQYIFLHDALLEALISGDTDVAAPLLSHYLMSPSLLQSQFQLITVNSATDKLSTEALKGYNLYKNRNSALLPLNKSRVCLACRPGEDGSSYINASWIPGCRRLHQFVITQHPLDSTILDFWQMIWDINCQTIVVVSPPEANIFWPRQGIELEHENFSVHFIEETHQGLLVTQLFSVQSVPDDYEMNLHVFQYPGWPHCCSSLVNVFDLVHFVQELHHPDQNNPIVVMDLLGGTDAAIFCCLVSLCEQLELENCIDIYMYAKLINCERPGIWHTLDDYLFLYRVMENLVSGSVPPPKPDLLRTEKCLMNGHVTVERIPPEGMDCNLANIECVA